MHHIELSNGYSTLTLKSQSGNLITMHADPDHMM